MFLNFSFFTFPIIYTQIWARPDFDEHALSRKPPKRWTVEEIISIPPEFISEPMRKKLAGAKVLKSIMQHDPNDPDCDPRFSNGLTRLADAFLSFDRFRF